LRFIWALGRLIGALAKARIGRISQEMHDDRDRHRRYTQSRLSLTTLGQNILAGHDDFSRHNPIHRWWGDGADA
jgi:hypothetical protein